MSAIARQIGISKQTISMFLKDENHLHMISVDKLKQIQDFIKNL
jgi:transcriptional regulator with XRE-family HTH domain